MAQSVILSNGAYIDDSGVYTTEYGMTLKEALSIVLADGAGRHNGIYRGKYLGDAVTDAQYAAIADGTFRGLYIGDYWTINAVNYRIAAFDYFLNTGDPACTTHHAVMVPDTCLYNAQMNTSATTSGGYVGSAMYKTNLATAKTTIKAAFSGHVLTHEIYLVKAVSSGVPSESANYDSEVELMCETMVYGTVFSPVSNGSTVPAKFLNEKTQLPLFALDPSRLAVGITWHLRDVVSSNNFAGVHMHGLATTYGADLSRGVRPYFCIY